MEEENAASPAGDVTRLFPGGINIDEVYFPLLNSIAGVFPETFALFRARWGLYTHDAARPCSLVAPEAGQRVHADHGR